jgi:parvulin-like peptidyl-prolyl isomerase
MHLLRRLTLPIVLLGFAFLVSSSANAEPAIQLWNPVATVNGFIITPQDLDYEVLQLRGEMDIRNQPVTDQQLEELRPQLIENLINRELLYQQAQQKNMKIRSQWIDREIVALKQRFDDETQFRAYLDRMGMGDKQLRERIEKGLIVRRLMRRDILRQIKVSESEMQAFFRQHPEFFAREEQVRAKHILVAVKEGASTEVHEEAIAKIQAIQAQIEQGADFSVLALEFSDCPSKHRGGDVGYFSHDQMVRAFSDMAFNLQPGDISEIVVTRHGYHLIQLIDRRPPTQMAYKDAREKIERTLRRNKEQEKIEAYLTSIKRRADIKRF